MNKSVFEHVDGQFESFFVIQFSIPDLGEHETLYLNVLLCDELPDSQSLTVAWSEVDSTFEKCVIERNKSLWLMDFYHLFVYIHPSLEQYHPDSLYFWL